MDFNIFCYLFVYRDALIVVSMDTITSILAGFPVFMTMGYLANQLQSSVDKVLDSGISIELIYDQTSFYL